MPCVRTCHIGLPSPVDRSVHTSILGLLLAMVACSPSGEPESHSSGPDQDAISRASINYIQRVGDGIGQALEARFLSGGQHVVVLDSYTPHLRLFTAAGDPIWSGGPSGEGPHPNSTIRRWWRSGVTAS